jgi:hypothetical protein
LDRRAVRRCFEQRFTAKRMAAQYVRLYAELTARTRFETIMPLKVSTQPTAHAILEAPAP